MIGLWAPADGAWPEVLNLLSTRAAQQWNADVWKVQKLAKLLSTTDWYHAVPGSPLHEDNEEASPYQVSYAALQNLNIGVTQLQAAQEVIQEDSYRLVAAATLLRSSLEALAVALWIAHPEDRSERVAHALAWSMRNVTDERVAYADFAGKPLSDDRRADDIRRIGERVGVDVSELNGGIQSTAALRYADAALDLPNHLLLYVWRLCSGVAHGRPWALANLATTMPPLGVAFKRDSFDEANLQVPFRIAVVLLESLTELLEERTTPPSRITGRTDS